MCVCVLRIHLLLCDPGNCVLEAPARLLPGSRTPSGAPPSQGALDSLVDTPQLVFAHLHPANEGQEKGCGTSSERKVNPKKEENERESLPHVLTTFSLGCPCCLRSMAKPFSFSMVSFAMAM